MTNIEFIQTKSGIIPVVAKLVGEFLMVSPNGDVWTISHRPTGYAIAYLKTEQIAVAVAVAVAEIYSATIDWNWNDPNNAPEATKSKMAIISAPLSRLVEFIPQDWSDDT